MKVCALANRVVQNVLSLTGVVLFTEEEKALKDALENKDDSTNTVLDDELEDIAIEMGKKKPSDSKQPPSVEASVPLAKEKASAKANPSDARHAAAKLVESLGAFSDAHADVFIDTGPVENVFLSDAYEKNVTEDDGTVFSTTNHIIAVLCSTMADAERVTCKYRGKKEEGPKRTVRVSKPWIPSIFQKRNAKNSAIMMKVPEPGRNALTSSWLRYMKNHQNTLLVDVHAPEIIQPKVKRLAPSQLRYSEEFPSCHYCNFRQVLEAVNVALFEITYVTHTDVADDHLTPNFAEMSLSK